MLPMIPCPRAMDLAQIGTFRTSAMQNAFGLSMNSRRLVDADSAWRDLCEFVSFRTIVGELTLGTRMRRVCRSSCFRRRHVSCVGRHTTTIQGSVPGAESVSAPAPCRNGLCGRTHCFKGVKMSCQLTGTSDAPRIARGVSSPRQLWPRDRGNAVVRSSVPSRL